MTQVTLRPTSDDLIEWDTSSPPGTHYTCVDEEVFDDGANYIRTSTSEDIDRFGMSDAVLPSRITINWVRVYGVCQQQPAAQRQVILGVYIGGYFSTTKKNLTSSWATYYEEFTTNPSTSNPWTADDIDDLVAYIQMTNGSGIGVDCTQLYVVVDYDLDLVNYEITVYKYYPDNTPVVGVTVSCVNVTADKTYKSSADTNGVGVATIAILEPQVGEKITFWIDDEVSNGCLCVIYDNPYHEIYVGYIIIADPYMPISQMNELWIEDEQGFDSTGHVYNLKLFIPNVMEFEIESGDAIHDHYFNEGIYLEYNAVAARLLIDISSEQNIIIGAGKTFNANGIIHWRDDITHNKTNFISNGQRWYLDGGNTGTIEPIDDDVYIENADISNIENIGDYDIDCTKGCRNKGGVKYSKG